MKISSHHAVALLFSFFCASAHGVEFVWSGHGVVRFDVLPNWLLKGEPAGDFGFSFLGKPKVPAVASFQLTFVALPPDKPALTKDGVKNQLERLAQPYVANSVERKFSPVALKLQQGYGWYAEFTDPSLVGKPSVPDDYKITRLGSVAFNDGTAVVITM